MVFLKRIREIIILVGISVILAMVVNFLSPKGIALVGQWDTSRGVISAGVNGPEEWEPQKINSVAANPAANLSKDFSIAMPANAVIDYLRRVGGMENAKGISLKAKQDNVILGLSEKSDKKLVHWVYKKNDNAVYNWGKKVTLTDLLKEFNIVYQIGL